MKKQKLQQKKQKNPSITALKKASTLLLKIVDMIQKEEHYVHIIQQVFAVMWLLKSATTHLLQEQLRSRFVDATKAGNMRKINTLLQEITTILKIAQTKKF